MLNKNEIIKELTNEEFIVRNAIYEYVCNLHLYDDEGIKEAFIKFIEDNYKEINFCGLVYSKLNKDIIESLIKISVKEENELIQERISSVLVEHYNLIKDMEYYNFEEIITDEENLLLYKKIKHFSKKDPTQLIELYKNNINAYYFSEQEEYVTEILRMAMGIALIQTEEGFERLMSYIYELIEPMDGEIEEFTFEHMPYLVYPLCQYADPSYDYIILNLYINNMDFLGYAEECNYYFSNIGDEEFVDFYRNTLKSFDKKDLEAYYYDIAEYLNSDRIDQFLWEELKRNKDKEIKENIIGILAKKFDKNIIPYALEFIRKGEFVDEEGLKEAIAPLLILKKCEDETSKKIIQEVKDYDNEFEDIKSEMMSNLLNGMQNLFLKNEPHIKEYRRIRKLHNEIMESMMKYLQQGKFELKIDRNMEDIGKEGISYINCKFDTSTELGIQAMANAMVYKNACNMNCITEEFIKNNRYKTQEKIELLESMLNSEAGLFEITRTDREKGQVYLRNVLNNKEYCITDIGFSSNLRNDTIYVYTRVITYHGISFGTGLNIAFDKKDVFIGEWIQENLKDFDTKQEISRFMELYNKYEKDENRVKVVSKNFKKNGS